MHPQKFRVYLVDECFMSYGVDIIDLDSVDEETMNSMLKLFLGDSNEQSVKISSIIEL